MRFGQRPGLFVNYYSSSILIWPSIDYPALLLLPPCWIFWLPPDLPSSAVPSLSIFSGHELE
jgi:hypothetical protein